VTGQGDRLATSEDTLLAVLDEACDAVPIALADLEDWDPVPERAGQYRLDLAADAAVLPVLHGAGLAVLSEESGWSGEGPLLAVVDPVDGSTNAHRGLWGWSTSICVVDDAGPLASVVADHVSGSRWRAVRGGGATCDDVPVRPSGCTALGQAIIGIGGYAVSRAGWAQFRTLGCASLELCAVADGSLDGYSVAGDASLRVWDYLGALLVCHEAGAVLADRRGADLVVRDGSPRHPVAAASATLLEALLAAEI
jgi:fructose-1,6-bisphosphatase/inositol monophosphatase family enzyme